MRISLTIGCVLLSASAAVCSAGEPPRTGKQDQAGAANFDVHAILRQASELVMKQDDEQRDSFDRLLLDIGSVQVRAGDFDGALRSFRGSTDDCGREEGLEQLAAAIARAGNRQRAFEVLHMIEPDDAAGPCNGARAELEDHVQLQCIEHLLGTGDLESAAKATQQLQTDQCRPAAQRKLAIAYASSGDRTQAERCFALALKAASEMRDDYDRVRAYWEIAAAQLKSGTAETAKEVIQRLLETAEPKYPLASVASLCELAVLAAKTHDDETARRLFRRAIAAPPAVNAINKFGAFQIISAAQARAGLFDDALQTAAMIPRSENYFPDQGREQAMLAILAEKLLRNDVDGAIRMASSVVHRDCCRDVAFRAIVEHQIGQHDLDSALAAAEQIGGSSIKAIAVLKVATAHARLGDRKTAADVAARIELTESTSFLVINDFSLDDLLVLLSVRCFDYQGPRTWAVEYDELGIADTLTSSWRASKCAAQVAAAAMTLAQTLEQQPEQSYAVLFDDVDAEEIIQALARAHAVSGDPRAALAWAERIGSSDIVKSQDDDYGPLLAVQRRIHALIGVAEGVLDRSSPAPIEDEE